METIINRIKLHKFSTLELSLKFIYMNPADIIKFL